MVFKLHHGLLGGVFWAGFIIALVFAARGQWLLASLAGLVPISAAVTINDFHLRIGGTRFTDPGRWAIVVWQRLFPCAWSV